MPVNKDFMDMVVGWADDPPRITTEAEQMIHDYDNELLKPSAEQLASVLKSLLDQQKFDAENRNLYRSALVIAQELWQPYFNGKTDADSVREMMEEFVHVIGGALCYRSDQSMNKIKGEKELTIKEWLDTDVRDYIVSEK